KMKRYLLRVKIVLMVCQLLIAGGPLSIAQKATLPFSSPWGRPGGAFLLPEGSLSVEELSLCQQGDSLHLSMKLYIISQSINSCQSWRIRPEVRSEEASLFLPSLLINGKKKEQQYERRTRMGDPKMLGDDHLIKEVANPRTGHHFYYEVKVPYELWMDEGVLHFHQILTSCRDREQWFSLYDVAAVEPAVFTPYRPQVRVNYIEPEEEAKIREMQGVAFLDFRPGNTEIVPSYRRNAQELSKIEASIRSVRENPDVTLLGLHIHGYASPEGSYSLNERLSKGRAEGLSNYLRAHFSLPQSILSVTSTAEDWQGLREKVEESDLPGRESILEIIDSAHLTPDQKEGRLKALGGTYQTLLNQYFPSLRRVSYRIEYTVRDYTALEAEALLEENPGNLSAAELFRLAESYGEDSGKWGEILQLSALLYPDEPVTQINLMAYLLQKGDIQGAAPLIERIKEEPYSANNVGAYYLLTREPEKAKEYLEKANQQGILSSEHNLSEWEKVKEDVEREKARKKK
ncbi:MAG: DUF3868 domain-containing protein, partial [Tannerellaceae bacterium]|nr:DUF3868 domain-containing protein [Tannerellaceae bacterium]